MSLGKEGKFPSFGNYCSRVLNTRKFSNWQPGGAARAVLWKLLVKGAGPKQLTPLREKQGKASDSLSDRGAQQILAPGRTAEGAWS